MTRFHLRAAVLILFTLGLVSGCTAPPPSEQSPTQGSAATASASPPAMPSPEATASAASGAPVTSPSGESSDIHKIKHVVVIMQENRTFDSYFGTYPGADGIPMQNGVPTVCVPDPITGQCVRPYADRNDRNGGGPHNASNSSADVDGGKMDGFITKQV